MAAFNGLKKYWPYRNGHELQNLYAKAVEHDKGFIDVSQPRLHWSESADDGADLERRVSEGSLLMQSREPDYRIDVRRTAPGSPNEGRYAAFLFD
ncbi:hypothetical protein AB0K45_09625 [Micrococcus luteus]|uniref:hypothetical protein n=1 Tax=Micrococcus luteus TaxID=1270 RepID=UPI003417466E